MVVLLSSANAENRMPAQLPRLLADVDPGPALVVEPRMKTKALSKDRVAPMFRATPVLRGKLATVKSRDSEQHRSPQSVYERLGHVTLRAPSAERLAMRRSATLARRGGRYPRRLVLRAIRFRWPSSARRSLSTTRNPAVLDATIKGCSRIDWPGCRATSASISCRARTAVSSRCWSWVTALRVAWPGRKTS